MSTQRAIVVQAPGKAVLVDHMPIPQLPDDYILVKTKAVALNPTDWRHIDYVPCTGAIVGCDYAGIVEAVGPQVQKAFRRGDRVAGFVHGSNAVRPDGGAFAEYVIAKGDLQIHLPDSVGFEAGATLGVGITTVGQNLYQSLEVPLPSSRDRKEDHDNNILIYGGATATGSLAIQFAKLSGMRVVTTCSDTHRPWMYELGADAVFDYHDPRVGEQINEDTEDCLHLALDTISTTESARICASALSAGGCYNSLLDIQCPRSDIDSHVSMAYDILGEDYRMGSSAVKGESSNLMFGIDWWNTVEAMLEDRQFSPHPHQVKPGGMQGILDGLQLLREGKVRACKLVYLVDVTP